MSALLDRVEYVPVITEEHRPSRLRPRLVGSARALLSIAVGILLCANPWTAALVVGWTFRAMRRRILRAWWRRSPRRDEIDFDAWIAERGDGIPAGPLPRWLLSERFLERLRRPGTDGNAPGRLRIASRLPGGLFGGLSSNLSMAIRAVGCTYLVTLPACGLWLGSWYDGWNTSFTKGYENAFVGVQTGLFAHALFIAAMLYVPMAWAHLAASGRARAFFQVGLIARLVWWSGGSMALYALAFAAATLPVLLLRAAPFAFVLDDPAYWAAADPAEVRQLAEQYEMAAGVYLFAAFVGMHLLAARVYRSALPRLLADDPARADDLPTVLRDDLRTLALIPAEAPRRGPLVRASRWSARTTVNVLAGFSAALLWFAVVAEVYVGQFFNFIPWAGWLNQPLIHLPCLQTTPAGL